MTIASLAVGCDHDGYPLKDPLIAWARSQGFMVQDFGTHSTDSVDYPDFVHPVARAVEDQDNTWGILICGSANGVAITANKYAGVRAAICWTPELASLARRHNDANILCLPARFVTVEEGLRIAAAFFSEPFDGGRHEKRVRKINPGYR